MIELINVWSHKAFTWGSLSRTFVDLGSRGEVGVVDELVANRSLGRAILKRSSPFSLLVDNEEGIARRRR
jgi:hypothetical protein